MQHPAAIPPYDPAEVQELIGEFVGCPSISRSGKFWWGMIKQVQFIHPHSVLVCFSPNSHMGGKQRWVGLHELKWRGQSFEPLIGQMRKARWLAARAASKTSQRSR